MSKHVLSVLGAAILTLAIAAIALAQTHYRHQDGAKSRRHLHNH